MISPFRIRQSATGLDEMRNRLIGNSRNPSLRAPSAEERTSPEWTFGVFAPAEKYTYAYGHPRVVDRNERGQGSHRRLYPPPPQVLTHSLCMWSYVSLFAPDRPRTGAPASRGRNRNSPLDPRPIAEQAEQARYLTHTRTPLVPLAQPAINAMPRPRLVTLPPLRSPQPPPFCFFVLFFFPIFFPSVFFPYFFFPSVFFFFLFFFSLFFFPLFFFPLCFFPFHLYVTATIAVISPFVRQKNDRRNKIKIAGSDGNPGVAEAREGVGQPNPIGFLFKAETTRGGRWGRSALLHMYVCAQTSPPPAPNRKPRLWVHARLESVSAWMQVCFRRACLLSTLVCMRRA